MSDNNEHIVKWLEGELTTPELRDLIGDDALKYAQIDQEITQWEPAQSEQYLTDVHKIIHQEKEPIIRSISWWKPLSIAASVVLLLSFGFWYWSQSSELQYHTEAGQTREILLPDGVTTVILAAASQLLVDEGVWDNGTREVKLSGKAYFSVEPGDPFKVIGTKGEVTVLGTRFTVDEYGNSLQVTCYEGKVRAKVLDAAQTVAGGESFLYHNGTWEDNVSVSESMPLWLSSESNFKNAPLEKVIETLEKQFDIEVLEGKVNLTRRFTGSFPNNNLQSALQIVFSPLDIKYELKKDKVYLSQ